MVEARSVCQGENRLQELMRKHKDNHIIQLCFKKFYGVNTPQPLVKFFSQKNRGPTDSQLGATAFMEML
jgi:hypothetical protein